MRRVRGIENEPEGREIKALDTDGEEEMEGREKVD